MRCPKCKRRVTPFTAWICSYKNDPPQCPACGLLLRPSYRACWALLLAVLLVLPILLLIIPIIQDWLQNTLGLILPTVATRLLVGGPMVAAVFFVLWVTGTYLPEPMQIEESCGFSGKAADSTADNQERKKKGSGGRESIPDE